VILAAWVLMLVYVLWANAHLDDGVDGLRVKK